MIIYGIIVVVLIGLVIKTCRDTANITKNGVYLIGRIDDVRGAYKGRHAYVSYKYQDRIFKNDLVTTEIYMNDKGKRYFFLIDTMKPHKFRIQFNILVPDTIREVPYNGWGSLPVQSY